MKESEDRFERQLDELLASYSQACETPEPSVNFMPELWNRIEARQQTWSSEAWRWARGLMAAAAVASFFLAMLQVMPRHASVVYTATYLETLDAAHDTDDLNAEAVPAASDDSQSSKSSQK